MIVGEIIALEGDIELNAGREVITLKVGNSGGSPDPSRFALSLL